jgi:hypothetical protein
MPIVSSTARLARQLRKQSEAARLCAAKPPTQTFGGNLDMEIRRISLFVWLFSCSLLLAPEAYSQNLLLRELAQEDQDYRRGKKVARTDAERLKLVLAEIGKGAFSTPEDKTNAALVLQHTGLTYCENRLVSLSPDNYLLAHQLAKSAFESGYQDARNLVAQTLDRYLSFTAGYQKYGTNRISNQATGKEEWTPIDRNTPYSERAKYGVPPLAQLLKQFPEQQSKKAP